MANLFSLQDLFAAGLGFDISGAYLLGRGLLSSVPEMARVSATYWGVSRPEQLRLVRDKIDGSFGLGALVVGFTFQLIAYALTLAIDTRTEYGAGRAAVAAGLAIVAAGATLGAWRLFRNRLQRRLIFRFAHIGRNQQVQELPDRLALVMFGQGMGHELRDGETHEEYVLRVWNVERSVERE
jgi:hypothetical protein